MSRTSSNRPITAKELMDRLDNDPEYQALIQEKERQRLARMAEHMRFAQPIIDELKGAGINYDSLDDLRESGTRYIDAIPILVRWLPIVQHQGVKDSIVRTLIVPWANPLAIHPLVTAFREAPNTCDGKHNHLKLLIAWALECIANENDFDTLTGLLRDPTQGVSRQSFVRALGKMKNPRVVDVLVELIDDPDVTGAILEAFRKMGTERARPYFERFQDHPNEWFQKEARKGLEKLDKKAAKKK